jgi:hypothetical protein
MNSLVATEVSFKRKPSDFVQASRVARFFHTVCPQTAGGLEAPALEKVLRVEHLKLSELPAMFGGFSFGISVHGIAQLSQGTEAHACSNSHGGLRVVRRCPRSSIDALESSEIVDATTLTGTRHRSPQDRGGWSQFSPSICAVGALARSRTPRTQPFRLVRSWFLPGHFSVRWCRDDLIGMGS